MDDVTNPTVDTTANVEPSTTEPGDTSTTTTDVTTDEPKTIPYPRFREVNEKVKGYEATVEKLNSRIKELEGKAVPGQATDPQLELARKQIKELGFIDKADYEADKKRQDEDSRLENTLTQLESKHDGSDGLPKFNRQKVIDFALAKGIPDPAIAYRVMHEKDILDYNVKQALTKGSGIKTETSDGSGSSQAGTTDDDLKAGIKAGDKQALHTFLKRIVPK